MATQVVELLDKLALEYATLPIFLILDNATKMQACPGTRKNTGDKPHFPTDVQPQSELDRAFLEACEKGIEHGFIQCVFRVS